jgi:hypothetical protein
MANIKEAFVVRPADTEEKEFIITIGNHLATEEKFKSRKAAEMRINKTDWNLVSALVYALKEADKWAEKNKELLNENKETEE